MVRSPATLLASALTAIALTPRANHAFPPPAALASSPPLPPSSSRATTTPVAGPSRPPVALDGTSRPTAAAAAEPASEGPPPRGSVLRRVLRTFDGAAVASIRGDRYGPSNGSTVLAPSDAARRVGVEPTAEASNETWKRAWRFQRFAMRMLHGVDGCRPKDSKLALAVLWWKALAGNNVQSPVYDHELAYDLLPPVTRRVVHPWLCRRYPRLHHANVEIRTAYLDQSVSNVINAILGDDATTTGATSVSRKKIRLIVMGGGYDTRSVKLVERSLLRDEAIPHRELLRRKHRPRRSRRWPRLFRRQNEDIQTKNCALDSIASHEYDLECHELDLPEVVRAKRRLFERRLLRRRPWLRGARTRFPSLVEADLNDLEGTRRILEGILSSEDGDGAGSDVSNVILFEGVMIYLDEGVPRSLLELCSDVLREYDRQPSSSSSTRTDSSSGYLCFADRLENVPGGDEDAARAEMDRAGWELTDWLSKPGLARHMGVARLRRVFTKQE
ncbi:hypothetical protein ACHAWF_012712 [Thalassiosira exigua]